MAKRSRSIEADGGEALEAQSVGTPAAPRDVTYRSTDGLRLHVRDHGDRLSPYLPVVCLPGLTRTARDFEELATYLASHRHRPRRVLAFDYRGRGGSDWDTNVEHYTPLTEMNDVFDGMAALGVARAVMVGTSRGGIIGMLMGVARPAALAGLVLNDIGPVLEAQGLARIKTYVGRTPPPIDWDDAIRIQERLHGAQFTALDTEDWRVFARLTYRDMDGRPVSDYDPALASTLDGIEFDRPIPTLWDQFRSLGDIPVLAIRGENSDLLSAATLAEMGTAHPHFEAVSVPGMGHPPLLRQPQLLQQISAFVTRIEGAGPPAEAVVPRAPVAFDLDAPAPAPRYDREPEAGP